VSRRRQHEYARLARGGSGSGARRDCLSTSVVSSAKPSAPRTRAALFLEARTPSSNPPTARPNHRRRRQRLTRPASSSRWLPTADRVHRPARRPGCSTQPATAASSSESRHDLVDQSPDERALASMRWPVSSMPAPASGNLALQERHAAIERIRPTAGSAPKLASVRRRPCRSRAPSRSPAEREPVTRAMTGRFRCRAGDAATAGRARPSIRARSSTVLHVRRRRRTPLTGALNTTTRTSVRCRDRSDALQLGFVAERSR